MINVARWHTLLGLCFAVVGMALGIAMASSQDHTQHVTHAHILLLGLVLSLLYGMVYRLWLPERVASGLALAQFTLHQLGTLFIAIGLYLLYGKFVPEPTIGPLLGVASSAALLGALLMLVMFVRAGRAETPSARLRQFERVQRVGRGDEQPRAAEARRLQDLTP